MYIFYFDICLFWFTLNIDFPNSFEVTYFFNKICIVKKKKVVVLGSPDETCGASFLFLPSDISVCLAWRDIVGKGRRLIVELKLYA